MLVELLNFANQQPSLFRLVRALALATPGANEEAAIILATFQNLLYLSSQEKKHVCPEGMLEEKRVSFPEVHGPHLIAIGTLSQDHSPKLKRYLVGVAYVY